MKNSFTIPIIPENDAQRLSVLRRYEILDTPPEGAFNRVAELAVKIFQVPIALVSLVDKEQVFFKANVGMPGIKYADRGISLCSLAVMQDEPVVFEDAENEPCLVANPLVAGSFGLKFYAGAPLITHDGYNIGTICIVDKAPRSFSERDTLMLQDLASIVMEEMEIRIAAIKAARSKNELMHIAAHDLKNPLFNIQALSSMIKEEGNNQEKDKMLGMIDSSTTKMIALIDKLAKLSEVEDNEVRLDLKLIDPAALVRETVLANQLSAANKHQDIKLKTEVEAEVMLDKSWFCEIIDNLLSNAIKYSKPGKSIEVMVKSDTERLLLEVKDQGQGFSEDDIAKAFKKFTKLSSLPTAGETSTGLGLSIVKALVELHKGNIHIESEGKDKGSKIVVMLPNLQANKIIGKESSFKQTADQ